jgi:pimeloyl-ACP methyl ester carboxylesterase
MPQVRLDTGVDVHYDVAGSGEPLILIPGTGFAGDVWDLYQTQALAKNLKVITFDQRGCGRSSAPQGVYTIEDMACDVASLLTALGIESAHVLGHSMGGRIAIALALSHPRKVRSLFLAAAGSGTAARPGEECVPGLPYRMVDELVRMGFEKFVRAEFFDTTTYFTKDFLAARPDIVKRFYEVAWNSHAKWEPFLRLIMARHTWDATHRLGDIKAPTLVVVGDNDDVGSNHVKQAVALSQKIRGAETFVFKGQSHGFFWQAPDETNSLILDWVSRAANKA